MTKQERLKQHRLRLARYQSMLKDVDNLIQNLRQDREFLQEQIESEEESIDRLVEELVQTASS